MSQVREGTVLLVLEEDTPEFGPSWHRAVLTDGRFVSPPVPPGTLPAGAVIPASDTQ